MTVTPYPTFHEITDPKLRAWNRLNVIFNMKETVGNAASVDYSKQFDKQDKIAIVLLAAKVIKQGYENVRREFIRKEFA